MSEMAKIIDERKTKKKTKKNKQRQKRTREDGSYSERVRVK